MKLKNPKIIGKCDCGCGQKTSGKYNSHTKKLAQYVYSHQNKGKNNPMYGKKHKEETKKKMCENHPSKKEGYVHPKGPIGMHWKVENTSNYKGSIKGRNFKHKSNINYIGNKNSLGRIPWNKNKTWEEIYGKEGAEEMVKLISKQIKKTMAKPEIKEKMIKNIRIGMAKPETRELMRKNRAKQILPKKDSSIEVKIQNFLKQLKIEFFTHQYMKIEHGYQCDILIPSMNLVIECDGDFIHCNPNKYSANFKRYPNTKGDKPASVIWERDHMRTSELLSDGFKVLRLWGSEIKRMELNDFRRKLR